MKSAHYSSLLLILPLLAMVSLARAGVALPVAVLDGNPTPMATQPLSTKWFGNAVVGATVNGAVETATVTFYSGVGDVSIDSITTTGDFAVAGGTCVGATGLLHGQSCTLDLTFTPTAVGDRWGQLNITCRVVTAVLGIVGLVCNDIDQVAYLLHGTGLLAQIARAVPMLGREGLTLLLMAMFAVSLLALRRKRRV